MRTTDSSPGNVSGIEKCLSGIEGLDEITGGGLPRGRATLVCGSAGCGKTLLAMRFLVHGATELGEPGVFVSFEETPSELAQNVASMGVDLERLARESKLAVKHIVVDASDIAVAGEYDLEGLFIQIASAVASVGARRVVLDTIETLFTSFPNDAILRSELQRLFRWLKDQGLTAVITGERGEKSLTRHGLEEYVADCVISLDHRVAGQVATRRLRIVKYRGSDHGADEYPFLIDTQGITVLPITSVGAGHAVSSERISTGVPRLDAMLGGEGLYRGSSVLISGSAGTGKSSLAASFAHESCRRGERVLYVAFEESEAQIVRNMRSIGFDLQQWVDSGLLLIVPTRSTARGLELHLATIHKAVGAFKPLAVVIDPISNLIDVGSSNEVKALLTRLMDLLKSQQVTSVLISLTRDSDALGNTEAHISSVVDTWLILRNVESDGERNRLLHIIKSRGMAHSNQLREFLITPQGIQLRDVYLGPGGVLTGTARQVQEAAEAEEALGHSQRDQARKRDVARKLAVLDARIAALRAEAAAELADAEDLMAKEASRMTVLNADRVLRSELRQADAADQEGT